MGKRKRKYWILYHHRYCPVCGYEETYKERVYDKPKPKDLLKRHDQDTIAFHCGY